MTNQNIELNVLVAGRPVKSYGHSGRTFIEAKVGSEYSLRIRNNNSARVLAVVSVDGVDVISGKEASYNGSGYIIEAYSSIEVKGYRKDMSAVGAFKFTKKKKAYTKAVSGSTENVGVISVAAFAEKAKPVVQKEYVPVPYYVEKPVYIPYRRPYWDDTYYLFDGGTTNRLLGGTPTYSTGGSSQYGSAGGGGNLGASATNCSNSATSASVNSSNTSSFSKGGQTRSRSAGGGQSANFCSLVGSEREQCGSEMRLDAVAPKFSVGSSWGQQVKDEVRNESFERASATPFSVLLLYYDSRENLQDIGIDFEKKPKVSLPNGFPSTFAQPPVGWNG